MGLQVSGFSGRCSRPFIGSAHSLRSYHRERMRYHTHLHGRLADIFAVGVDVDGTRCLYPDAFHLEVVHPLDPKMAPPVDRREQRKQLELWYFADDADVQKTILQGGAWSDPHSAAVGWGIGNCGQQRRLRVALGEGVGIGGRFLEYRDTTRVEAREAHRQSERVPTMCSQPGRQAVSQASDRRI